MNEICVNTVKYPDRENLVMRYTDPVTGRQKTKSSGTANRKEAERRAAKWEAELREGRYHAPSKITWSEFRERYESDVLASLARTTHRRVHGIFNSIERILNPRRLWDVTAERLSHYQRVLRDEGRSESTIGCHLAHLQSALRWAAQMGMLPKAPTIQKPRRARKTDLMKGRPITMEEFERMLDKVPAVVGTMASESWRHYLRGLWLSGLRLGESLSLSWDDESLLHVDLSGEFPMLRIPAELEKGNKDRLLPIVPEFAEMLTETPKTDRIGFVFSPLSKDRSTRVGVDRAGRMICQIGRAAGVKVVTKVGQAEARRASKPQRQLVKYASAHDLRRAFGERWATRVMPAVLKELMRHESIDTTLRYYVGQNAQKTASVLWEAHKRASEGNITGNSASNHSKSVEFEIDTTPASPKHF